MNDVQLFLVSGFMGAGKTTFLQNILTNYEGFRVGVIVNEFGSVSVDGRVLQREGIEIVEINNGSIFCACLKSGFINTLIAFSKENIDCLFIENSGLGDPSNFLRILEEIEPYTSRKYQFRGAICLVDAEYFLDYHEIFTPVENQVAASNFVLVNKTDLADAAQLDEIHRTIQKINPAAFIHDTQYGKIPFAMMSDKLNASAFSGETSNHDWNRPASYTISSAREIDPQRLALFLEKIAPKVLRLKGFLKSADGFWHVDMVGEHYQIAEADTSAAEKPEIVIIGKDSEDFKGIIEDSWQRQFAETLQIESF